MIKLLVVFFTAVRADCKAVYRLAKAVADAGK